VRPVRSPVALLLLEAMAMIVIGVDVHKHSLTAVAVDEAGRQLDQLTVEYPDARLFDWAARLGGGLLRICRHVTGLLERRLVAAGEEIVRVPPKLTGAARRGGRTRGKSDPIDALAVARVALREPNLDRPRAGEGATGS
jgi:transposase